MRTAYARLAVVAAIVTGLVLGPVTDDAAAQGVATGYSHISRSIVKVWALDAHGAPIGSGTGIIVASDSDTSTVLVTAHSLKNAASVRVDVDVNVRNIVATVSATSTTDLALLTMKQGNLVAATFASRAVAVGDRIAAAGFLTKDEAGPLVQHLFSPGTVSALIRGGQIFEFSDFEVGPGVGGAPVFDPKTGSVVGIIASSADANGGYAITARVIATAFFNAQHVHAAYDAPPAPATAIPARLGHAPNSAQPWSALDGLPGVFWLWASDGYGSDGYQTVDVYVYNDYEQTVYFFPEVRFSLEKPYDFYFNDKRIYSVASSETRVFRLKFPIPRAVQGISVTVHDVRFGTDTGALLLPR